MPSAEAEPRGTAPGGLSRAARERLHAERRDIAWRRTHQFLVAQTTILAIALVLVALSLFTRALSTLLFVQSITFCGVVAVLTGLGWWCFRTRRMTTPLVVALLYVDSVVGIFFLYMAGEFETPGIGVLWLCIVMAPIFAERRHEWGLAATQIALYSILLAVRELELLPYGYMLPPEALREPAFLLDSWLGFTLVTLATAYLAGRASIDILGSQQQLEDQVATKTQELAMANAQLATRNAELQRSNARLGEFNRAVSHDLRGPLQTLVSHAELLALHLDDTGTDRSRDAELIADMAHGMGQRINELLRLSRYGDHLDEAVPVDLDAAAADVLCALDAHVRGAGASVEIGGPLGMAKGNGPLLQELIQNLVENGIKYGGSTAQIRILPASAPDGDVAFAVEDDGEGVPPDQRSEVFRLFRRLDQHAHIDGQGTGLAIVQRIVDVHGGSVRVESGQLLKGARFVVNLPRA